MSALKKLTLFTAFLCFIVVGVGAYVRLSDAGLGCPDWPGCYGQIGVPQDQEQISKANKLFPNFPVDIAKAWKEMIHRYLASFLGILILIITFFSYRLKFQRLLTSSTLAVVVFQGLLGMWTVTLLLKPAVVSAHLIGGIVILALLLTLYFRLTPISTKLIIDNSKPNLFIKILAILVLILVVTQIALGGWVSSNYAALVCNGFPACNGSFNPPADYENALVIWRKLGYTAEGAMLSTEALVAIHWLHRIGALILTIFLICLLFLLYHRNKIWVLLISIIFILQILLGIINVLANLPIAVAVAHNLGAVMLLSAILILNFSILNKP